MGKQRARSSKKSAKGAQRGGSLAAALKQNKKPSAQSERLLDPLLYVALHSGTAGDVGFYLAQVLGEEALHLPLEALEEPLELPSAEAKRAELSAQTPKLSVLELGCGAGRVSLPLLEGGARVVGVDTHPGLLKLLEVTAQERGLEPHLKLIEADMRTLNLKERFDVVLITYNTLYCALSWDEQVDCLARAAAHLKPQGRLLVDGYALPDPEEFSYETDDDFEPLMVIELPELSESGALAPELWRLRDAQFVPLSELEGAEAPLAEEGALVERGVGPQEELDDELEDEDELISERHVGVEERDVHEQQAQRCDVLYRFRYLNGTQTVEQIEHRYVFPKQLPEMLESAGLSVEAWWCDFEEGEPTEETEQWALSATLKGSTRLTQGRR